MFKRNHFWAAAGILLVTLFIISVGSGPAQALTTLPATVIDDFNDGDAGDWFFFSGNNAGGGGGALDDRPYEGTHYFSTGWGGDGTASSFYGGTFKNFDNGAQIVPPADPWLNVWVLNQSNATVDQYNLEITIREDTNGDGWVDGTEDSAQLVTTYTSSSFDDTWTLLSAPVSSFNNIGAGGDDVFNGNLDEIVIVIGGVEGGPGSVVEVDFDQISFTSGGPIVSALTVFDDMEHGNPLGNGWFAFGGAVGGGGIDPNNSDLPPENGGAFSLQTGWGSGGNPGFYGGFGRTNPTDLTGTDTFSFWINPDAGQDYTLEINLQDDDNGDGATVGPNSDDDEFQFNCTISPTGPCAVAGGGWQLVSIPLADFFDDNSFFNGGNGVLDAVPTSSGGNGQLINVVIAVIGNSGSDATFRTDYWVFDEALPGDSFVVVDDFESGVAPGTPCAPAVPPLNFCTFSDGGSSVAISTESTPPAPVLPAVGTPNNVLRMDVNVGGFAGFIHGFESGGNWVPQDWSTSEGFALWFHGNNSGTTIFIDILDNRNPGSTTDDAERWTVSFTDDFSGWQLLEFPFSTFVRKEIGNGAPNDGFGLFEIHGWALGTLNTGGAQTFYMDEAAKYGIAEPPALAVSFANNNNNIEEGATGVITVKLNRPFGPGDPTEVSVDFATVPETSTATLGEEYAPVSGTLTFTETGPAELTFSIQTFDDTKFEGNERIALRLSNPVDVELPGTSASAFIVDNDPFDPNLLDDFEKGAFLWDTNGPVEIEAIRSESGDPDARPGQDPVENVLFASVPLAVDIAIKGNVCKTGNGVVPVHLLSTPEFDATTVDYSTVKFGGASETHGQGHVEDVNGDGLNDLVFHFRGKDIGVPCGSPVPFNGATFDGQAITAGGSDAAFGRDFALGQDWTGTESVSFWYYGAGNGEPVVVTLKDNRAPDPGPSGWELAWSDEFDNPAGSPPNPANWTHEIGDVTPDGKNGWGNEELQYYTDDPANASHDGDGNLVITLQEADGSLECYYGPCEYTSARLLSWYKAEFAYGRIESRLKVPNAGTDLDGLWPAFWSLGTDINRNPWPGAGEIDFMEWVGRLPNEIFGTIHGPGYSGGGSFGDVFDFGEPVGGEYHTFTVEWEPDLITWYVDGIQYHQATPTDVPGPWVFDKPFFLLLNFAIGGNFGGPVGDDVQFPQEYLIDYVRVFQGPDTAERFEASFTDDFTGWQQVTIPISDFTRSADQPAGAPNDGLGLDDVWGYGFALPEGNASGELLLDFVELIPVPPPTELTVTTLDDDGAGSLREAMDLIATDGVITFDPALAGGTIGLTSGQLAADRSMTIDGSGAAGLTVSGGNTLRVFQIAAGTSVTMTDMTIADGAGFPQGGGILNFGTLNLTDMTVTNNQETSGGPADFQLGGGGIYNGDGATLNLLRSTVSNNSTVAQPGGGIYGFFNSTINVTDSTVSGNVAADVAGGLRTLGDVTVVNSTISGNTSTAWHGGAMFSTDGTVTILNSTIVDNIAPAGTAGGLMIATFGAPVDATIQNSIIGNNTTYSCQVEGNPALAALTSLGNNVLTDGSCSPIGSDQVVVDPGVDVLADNGGPTLTHALLAGSPAIDSANAAACPATDQRGVARDAACDVGAFEFVP